MYSITTNVWSSAPILNEARNSHSSCVLDGKIFAFCGSSTQDKNRQLPSMEILDAQAVVNGIENVEWLLISLTQMNANFEPRSHPLVAPVSDDEIVILGGFKTSKVYSKTFLSDGFIFNLRDG